MTEPRGLCVQIDRDRGELRLLLDNFLASKDDQITAASLADACVGPGKSIRCYEEHGTFTNIIVVKIDDDSVLGTHLSAST